VEEGRAMKGALSLRIHEMEEELLALRRQREARAEMFGCCLTTSTDAHERNRILEAACRGNIDRAGTTCFGCE